MARPVTDSSGSLSCRSVLGIDIDPELARKARGQLLRLRKHLKAKQQGQQPIAAGAGAEGGGSSAEIGAALLAIQNVRFQAGDFGSGQCGIAHGSMDTIMVLSVSKWIHFHAGDHGKFFFPSPYHGSRASPVAARCYAAPRAGKKRSDLFLTYSSLAT